MSYLVIARKYRPQTFDDVIGQEHVATTLKNAISLERIAHAYLFTGPRGVGKTSMARIFAKALNCQKGPTTKPCGKCSLCGEITQGRSLDVIEIDGASNRGIEDIRTIRENIKFSPASGRFKIYIIDEVHQITQDGFNALLKTLEEPPAHVKFIFATTSPHKIPPTVLSRCQRFDFKRIPTKTISTLLSDIAKKEKLKIQSEALQEIAKAADGSLRDAESILDQISSFSKEKISFEDVAQSLGSMSLEDLVTLFESIADKKTDAILTFVDHVIETGKDILFFVEKCMEHTRNLMVIKTSPKLLEIIDGSDTYCERLQKQADVFSRQDLFYIFSILVQASQNVKRFNSKRIPLEMALLKCALREPMVSTAPSSPSSSVPPIANPPRVSGNPKPAAASKPEVKKNTESRLAEEVGLSLENPQVSEDPQDAAAQAQEVSDEVWENLIKRIRVEKMSAASYLKDAKPLEIKGRHVWIAFPQSCSFNMEALSSESNLKLLEKHLSDLLERPLSVKFKLDQNMMPQSDHSQGNTLSSADDGEGNEVLKKAIGIFGGRVVNR